jgi:hypothetical protein
LNYFCIFQKAAQFKKQNSSPVGESSTDLVTLIDKSRKKLVEMGGAALLFFLSSRLWGRRYRPIDYRSMKNGGMGFPSFYKIIALPPD